MLFIDCLVFDWFVVFVGLFLLEVVIIVVVDIEIDVIMVVVMLDQFVVKGLVVVDIGDMDDIYCLLEMICVYVKEWVVLCGEIQVCFV